MLLELTMSTFSFSNFHSPCEVLIISSVFNHVPVCAVSGYRPHHTMLVVSGQAGVVGMTREHIAISNALEVPLFIVITKTDLGSESSTLEHVKQLLKSPGCRKVSQLILRDS